MNAEYKGEKKTVLVHSSRWDRLSAIFLESRGTKMAAGAFGILLGLGTSFVISVAAASFGAPVLFSFAALDYFELAVILIITFITGVLSGLLPSRAASRLEPAEALRYE